MCFYFLFLLRDLFVFDFLFLPPRRGQRVLGCVCLVFVCFFGVLSGVLNIYVIIFMILRITLDRKLSYIYV